MDNNSNILFFPSHRIKKHTNLSEMSFEELMNESNKVMGILKRYPEQNIPPEILSEVKSIMNEFNSRIQKQSEELRDSVNKLKEQIKINC